ncbi:glycosyltransferase [Lactococcus allomyrinae]|uniref:Glycosyltransferase n=1 Tax=Lactococcus allomyrinae TaxID=2419773 RepID=A0A387BKL5_9LACT|nr:glycosyltransferase [Lactococcus allomyrinae]AYG01577.1 glycosyltransferase [Lactococcus allomyrinae]
MKKTIVLIATYNGQKYLTNQLDSIRQQEIQPDYVLLRDDGSTDLTVELIKNYIEKYQLLNWTIAQNEANIGWQKNFRQLLIDALSLEADYIFFSDQDDEWALDKIKNQLDFMENHSKCQLLSGDIEIKNIGEGDYHKLPFQFVDGNKIASKFPASIEYFTYRLGWTFAIKRQLAEKTIEFWKADYFIAHDVIFSCLSSLLGVGYNLNRSVGYHVVHGENASVKPSITISSNKAQHVRHLLKEVQFYELLNQILSKDENRYSVEVQKKLKFCKKRYELARENKVFPVFLQILQEGRMYSGIKSKLRDVIFAFKK